MKVRQLFARDTLSHDGGMIQHLIIVDESGSMFERFSDQAPGEWSEIPLPERKQKSRTTRRKRRAKR